MEKIEEVKEYMIEIEKELTGINDTISEISDAVRYAEEHLKKIYGYIDDIFNI